MCLWQPEVALGLSLDSRTSHKAYQLNKSSTISLAAHDCPALKIGTHHPFMEALYMVYLIPTTYGITYHISLQLIKLAANFAAFIWSRFSPTNRLTTLFVDGPSQAAHRSVNHLRTQNHSTQKTYAQRFP